MLRPPLRLATLLSALVLPLALASCWARVHGEQSGAETVLHLPIRSAGPGTFDPVQGSTTYDNQSCSLVYETLLQYAYLDRTNLEPLLLTEMPRKSEDGLTWSFELRDDVRFQDDECFESDENPDGRGRALVARDVVYSWKRLADKSIDTKNWWLVENTIAGFDDWRDERNLLMDVARNRRSDTWHAELARLIETPNAERPNDWKARLDRLFTAPPETRSAEWLTELERRFETPEENRDEDWQEALEEHLDTVPVDEDAAERFDFYDSEVPGLRVTGERTFEVELTEPVTRFRYVLAMFQLSVVPREAVEHYGWRFPRNPVGTGPYRLERWQTSLSLDYVRNPTYHDDFYPEPPPEDEWNELDERLGLYEDAGARLPFADRIRIHCYVQDQPMWLDFRSGVLDYAQIPAEYYEDAINKRTRSLKPKYADEGIVYRPVPLLDFIFRGFNCDPETSEHFGGNSERAKNLRRAVSLAIDLEEFNRTFYNEQNVVYDGMIPPDLDGYPEGGTCEAAYRGPDLQRARDLLAEAGHPNGEGLPTFDYYTSQAANSQEQGEMMKRQLARVGIEINPILLEFPQLIDAIDERRAPIFSFAWGSDYPDGENNLALFYGPNESPGSNHYNYRNDEYDRLYEKIRVMEPSPERTELYEEMRDIVLRDAAYVGSMARTRNYLGTPRLGNFKPSEDFWNWYKYLKVVDPDTRTRETD